MQEIRLPEEDQALLAEIASQTEAALRANYSPGFGLFPSADPNDNFYNEVYARDTAHAGANYFAAHDPSALRDSLETLLRHQRESGALPLRVEREYQVLRLIPGVRHLSRALFVLFNVLLLRSPEHPVFEGGDLGFSGSEDTIPVILIGVGALFIESAEGKQFVESNFEKLRKAFHFFSAKADPSDGLIVATHNTPDWADSIRRQGKLGAINVCGGCARWS